MIEDAPTTPAAEKPIEQFLVWCACGFRTRVRAETSEGAVRLAIKHQGFRVVTLQDGQRLLLCAYHAKNGLPVPRLRLGAGSGGPLREIRAPDQPAPADLRGGDPASATHTLDRGAGTT